MADYTTDNENSIHIQELTTNCTQNMAYFL